MTRDRGTRPRSLALAALALAGGCSDGGAQGSATTTEPTGVSSAGTDASGSGSGGAPTTGVLAPTTTTTMTTPTTTSGPTTGDVGATTAGTSGATGTTDADATATGAPGTTGAACSGLECQIDPCGGDPAKTRITGVVHTPKGTLPLYGVTVQVPGAPLEPPVDGVACDTCADGPPGDPIVATLTDVRGEFTLAGVPAGTDIPLVISVGKWRREVVVPEVVACAATEVPAELVRLPRDQSEGHLPRIAVATGKADTLECLLRKVGVADAEFTTAAGPGRVHLFAGATGSTKFADELGGAAFPPADELWGDPLALRRYDVALLSCEGQQYAELKSAQARQNIVDYADLGGRLFFSHWHNVWIEGGPAPWPTTASFTHDDFLQQSLVAKLDTSFPKGAALAKWMVEVGGSQQPGEVKLTWIKNTVTGLDPAASTRWVHTKDPAHYQYFSFNAPVGAPAAEQCGRVVNSDIHVVSGMALVDDPFPTSCVTKGLTPQEKIIVFMLFDLSACLLPDSADPIPG